MWLVFLLVALPAAVLKHEKVSELAAQRIARTRKQLLSPLGSDKPEDIRVPPTAYSYADQAQGRHPVGAPTPQQPRAAGAVQ